MISTLDRFAGWLLDQLNPILVRNLRQATRSRVYFLVFLLGLIACYLVLVLYTLSAGDYEGGMVSPGMGQDVYPLIYIALGVFIFLLIPFRTFMNHLEEVERDCLDLLTVTTLSSGQIIRGKFFSALAEMTLCLSTLVPFLAFSYLLRGLSLEIVFLSLYVALLSSILLIFVSLFLALLVRGSLSKFLIMGGLLFIGLYVLVILASLVGNDFSRRRLFVAPFSQQLYFLVGSGIVFGGIAVLLHEVTRCQILPSSYDRTAPVRISFFFVIPLAFIGYYILSSGLVISMRGSSSHIYWGVVWHLIGIFGFVWSTEDKIRTGGILHSFFNSRLPLILRTFLLPGGKNGFLWTMIVLLETLALFSILPLVYGIPTGPQTPHYWIFTISGYIGFYCLIGHGACSVIHSIWPGIKSRTKRVLGFVILVFIIITPYLISLIFIDNPASFQFGHYLNVYAAIEEEIDAAELLWGVTGFCSLIILYRTTQEYSQLLELKPEKEDTGETPEWEEPDSTEMFENESTDSEDPDDHNEDE